MVNIKLSAVELHAAIGNICVLVYHQGDLYTVSSPWPWLIFDSLTYATELHRQSLSATDEAERLGDLSRAKATRHDADSIQKWIDSSDNPLCSVEALNFRGRLSPRVVTAESFDEYIGELLTRCEPQPHDAPIDVIVAQAGEPAITASRRHQLLLRFAGDIEVVRASRADIVETAKGAWEIANEHDIPFQNGIVGLGQMVISNIVSKTKRSRN